MQTCDLLDSRFVCVLHLSSVGANVDVPLPGGVSSATTSGDGSIRVTGGRCRKGDWETELELWEHSELICLFKPR